MLAGEIALLFVIAKLSLHAVNVALTLTSILLKLACISISRTIEFVVIGGRCSRGHSRFRSNSALFFTQTRDRSLLETSRP